MTTEEDFQAALDADPNDHQTRLVLADWLQDRGDPRAEGYRALGTLRRQPSYIRISERGRRGVWWWADKMDEAPLMAWRLPGDWCAHLRVKGSGRGYYPIADGANANTRRAVEDAAAVAFSLLPPERRAELLAAAPPADLLPVPQKRTRRNRKK